jgi:hypothetical protein
MPRKVQTNPDESHTERADEATCSHCKGAGVIFTNDAQQAGVFCCDQCEKGRLVWARMLELLADMDVPSPIPVKPPTKDSIAREQSQRRYALTAPDRQR